MAGYAGYSGYDAESVKRQRAIADALYARMLNDRGQPIQHVTQGLAKLADAWFARDAMQQADTAEQGLTDSRKAIADKLLRSTAGMSPTESGPAYDLTPGAMETRQGNYDDLRNVADLTGDPLAAVQYGQQQQDRASAQSLAALQRQALSEKLGAPIEVNKGATLWDPKTKQPLFSAPGDPADPLPSGVVHSVLPDRNGNPHVIFRDGSDKPFDWQVADNLKTIDVGGVPYMFSGYGRDGGQPAPVSSPQGVGGNKATIETVVAEEKGRREAEQGLPDLIGKVQQTRNVVNQLVSHPGFASRYGFQGSMTPAIGGTPGAGAQALIDQIKGQAFLQAFESLKGGGQITEVEGNKATNAITRLTNQNLSQEEALAAAKEFMSVVDAGLVRAQAKASGKTPGYRAPARVSSDAEYDALKSGDEFIGPDGVKRRKP